jgi:putative copper export protein
VLDVAAALLKAALYAFALTAAGAALAAASLRPWPALEQYGLKLMRSGAVATLLLSVLTALLLIARLGGAFDAPTLSAVFDSGSGAALALQIAGAVLLLMAVGDDAFTRGWRAANALIIVLSFAFSGHAAAMSASASLVVFLHIAAAAWWVGSLWTLRRACESNDVRAITELVARFSRIGVYIVGALVVAGVVLIFTLVDFERSPWFTEYVLLLIVKVSLAALALGVAIHNKLRLTPPLLRYEPAAAGALRRTINAELAVIGAVAIATAILTTYASPHE